MKTRFLFKRISENKNSKNSIASLIAQEFETQNKYVNLFRKDYQNNVPEITNLVNQLKQELIEYWNLNGFEFNHIFEHKYRYGNEFSLISAIGQPLLGSKEKLFDFKNYRAPQLIEQLISIGEISEKDIIHPLEPVPNEDETIVTSKVYRHVDTHYNYKINDGIIKRIDNAFANVKPPSKNTSIIKQPNKQHFVSLEKTIAEVQKQFKNSTSGSIPLTTYGAILQIETDEFFEKHVLNLMIGLNIHLPREIGTNDIKKNEKFTVGTIIEKNTPFYMKTTNKYILMGSRLKNHWGEYHPNQEINTRVMKFLLETYCKKNNIPFFSESTIGKDNKIILMKKFESYKYNQQNKKRISKSIDNETILNLIDFATYTTGFRTEVDKPTTCGCGEQIVTGHIKYDREGYLPPIKNEFHLKNIMNSEISLEQLHRLAYHPEQYESNINELESIDQMLKGLENWNRVTIPEELVKDFIAIYKQTFEIDKAAEMEDDWMHAVHTTPNYAEEEMNAEHWKREEDERMLSLVNNERSKVTNEAKKIVNYFTKQQPNNLQLDINSEYKLGDTISGIYLVKESYKTIQAQQTLAPKPHLGKIVSAIETAKTIRYAEKQGVQPPTENLPLRLRRGY